LRQSNAALTAEEQVKRYCTIPDSPTVTAEWKASRFTQSSLL